MKVNNRMPIGGNAMRRCRGRQDQQLRQAVGQELDRLVSLATKLLLLGAAVILLMVGYLGWRGMR